MRGRLVVMRLLAAPDKFRGSATARQLAQAIGEAAWESGWDAIEAPMSDGGEGLLEVFGGPNRSSEVSGPLGAPVVAPWRLSKRTAVIEMAAASGLVLAGGAQANEPLRASTRGTGEIILAAAAAGAERIIVGLGGSASTDGGVGAVEAIVEPARLAGIELIAACDVDIAFVDAAARFAPQKGASPTQVKLLERRLSAVADRYRTDFGVDVTTCRFAGAAGGLAGGLAALGATLVSGFELVAEEVDLDGLIARSDLVVTGEGFLDAGSFDGKVVGGMLAHASAAGVPALVVVGDDDVDARVTERVDMVSMTKRFGERRSLDEPLSCVRSAVSEYLERTCGRGALQGR